LRKDHLPKTREWIIEIFERFLFENKIPDEKGVHAIGEEEGRDKHYNKNLFWLLGSSGTGKSVTAAVICHKLIDKMLCSHFSRHDSPKESEPLKIIYKIFGSLMEKVDGFPAEIGKEKHETLDSVISSGDIGQIFDCLILKPLQNLAKSQNFETAFILIDALDELPKESKMSTLQLITDHLSLLPSWIKLMVTSREETIITKIFNMKFNPHELRYDEKHNRDDLRIYLECVALENISTDIRPRDLELLVKKRFGFDMNGGMEKLQPYFELSRELYNEAMIDAKEGDEDALRKVVETKELRPSDLVQEVKDFESLYADAEEADEILRYEFGGEDWVSKKGMWHPKNPVAWIDNAISPGVKGQKRSKEKMLNDYGGRADMLRDLARISLIFCGFNKLVMAIKMMASIKGFKVTQLKNKFSNPTPVGYRDLNICVEVTLKDGRKHLCEVQLNHIKMIVAKEEAHKSYEEIRTHLPIICKEAAASETSKVGDSQETVPLYERVDAYIMNMINKSATDGPLTILEDKADGLFIYARLLSDQLKQMSNNGRNKVKIQQLQDLPQGLNNMYEKEFQRTFPESENVSETQEERGTTWENVKEVVAVITASFEKVPEAIMHDIVTRSHTGEGSGAVNFEDIKSSISLVFQYDMADSKLLTRV